MAFTRITITHAYGGGASGTVTFALDRAIGDGIDYQLSPLVATLDGSGNISISLPANSTPGTHPAGSQYFVTEALAGKVARRYAVTVPHDAGDTLDLSTLTKTSLDDADPAVVAARLLALEAGGGGGGGGGAVSSVNARTGAVVGLAEDSAVVHLTGAQTVAGVKTFSSAPVMPSASLPESAVANLTTDLAAKLAAASNLSDLASASTARTNLGLGGAATLAVGATTGTVAAGDDSRVTGAAQKASNLSDLASASTARTNLGLGTAATLASSAVAQTANNLSDVASASTARTNLGIVGTGDLSEYSNAAQTAAVTASGLIGKTARYNTTGGAISQALPAAVAGAVLAIGWDAGTAALTYTGATRSDSCGTTNASATVTDTSILAADNGRVVTGTGIPANTYVGTVTAGVSFLLSSSPTSQANVSATATGSPTLAITDAIGNAATTSSVVPVVGELVTLHCTTPGRWRATAALRTITSLDTRYLPGGVALQAASPALLLCANAAALPAGTPAGVVVVLKA